MDGYEATKHVRNELKLSKADLPIIALTASAIIEQRARAIQLGMNDFIAKPFIPEHLFKVITRHLPQKKINSVKNDKLDHIPPESVEEKTISFEFLLTQTNHNPELLEKIVTLFLDKANGYRQNLLQAEADQDFEQIKFLAHKLKSSAGMLGANKLESMLRDTELSVAEHPGEISIHHVVEELDTVINILKQTDLPTLINKTV